VHLEEAARIVPPRLVWNPVAGEKTPLTKYQRHLGVPSGRLSLQQLESHQLFEGSGWEEVYRQSYHLGKSENDRNKQENYFIQIKNNIFPV